MLVIRVVDNHPGVGWYWEVHDEKRQVLARGVTLTHTEARFAAERAKQTTLQLQTIPRVGFLVAMPSSLLEEAAQLTPLVETLLN